MYILYITKCFKRNIFPGRIDLNMNNCIKIHEKKKVNLKQRHSNCLKKKKKKLKILDDAL